MLPYREWDYVIKMIVGGLLTGFVLIGLIAWACS